METSGDQDREREGRCQDPGRETDRTVRGEGGATAQGGPGAGAGAGGSQDPGAGQDPDPTMTATGSTSEIWTRSAAKPTWRGCS